MSIFTELDNLMNQLNADIDSLTADIDSLTTQRNELQQKLRETKERREKEKAKLFHAKTESWVGKTVMYTKTYDNEKTVWLMRIERLDPCKNFAASIISGEAIIATYTDGKLAYFNYDGHGTFDISGDYSDPDSCTFEFEDLQIVDDTCFTDILNDIKDCIMKGIKI